MHTHDEDHPCNCGCDKFAGNTLSVHLKADNVREVMYLGREHIVLPVIMARADVIMNGARIPADELFPPAWNGVPVTIGHPQVADGFSTANDPDIMSLWAIGQIFNSKVEDGALKGEAWIDVERANTLRPGLVDALRGDEEMDVSTGYFSEDKKERGTLNGRRYETVSRNLNPDHLALLPDEMGACSWDDGCGVRANRENNVDEPDTLVGKLKTLIASAKKKPAMPYGDVPYADPGYQDDKKHRYPIDTEEHIRAAWSYINQKASEAPYSAAQLGKIKDKIVAAWKDKIDKAGPPAVSANARGDDNNPTQIIADLLSSDESPFTPDDFYGLQGMSSDTLCNLRDKYLGDPDDRDVSANQQEEPTTVATADPNAGLDKTALPTTVGELNTLIANAVTAALTTALPEALKPVTATMAANSLSADDKAALETAKKITADHRNGLVKKITDNSKMTKEQVEGMATDQLEIIANGLNPVVVNADFSGRVFGADRLAVPADDVAVTSMVPPSSSSAVKAQRAAKQKGAVN